MLKLYGYWRSSAAYRVRIALHLKGIEFENISVHLVNNGGEQHSAEYTELNSSELVPTLVDDDFKLGQSLAIIEYLESQYPQPALLPSDPKQAAEIKAFALDIACDIHPLNNLRVLQHLKKTCSSDDKKNAEWNRHWLSVGFENLEKKLSKNSGEFCFGSSVSLADVLLVPQVYNAHRYELDMKTYPRIQKIYEDCNQLDAFQKSAPEAQPDAR